MRKIMLGLVVAVFFTDVAFVQAQVNTVGQLDCDADQIGKWDGEQWICSMDVDTNAATECDDGQVLLGDGSCGDGSMSQISCAYGQVAKYNDVLHAWECADDTDTDTNATTECSDNEVLFANGMCVDASGLLLLPTERFVRNGDGTLTDNKNRLMWEIKLAADGSQGGNCNDNDQGDRDIRCVNNLYLWSDQGNGNFEDYVDPDGDLFTKFIKQMNENATKSPVMYDITAYNNWRVPTYTELYEFFTDCRDTALCGERYIDTNDETYLLKGCYWSNTTTNYESIGGYRIRAACREFDNDTTFQQSEWKYLYKQPAIAVRNIQ